MAGELLGTVARAVAWLACQGVIYTDVRGPNVLVDGAGRGWLVDFDDCMVVPAPVTSLEGYRDALEASPGAKLMNTFATSFACGTERALEKALDVAFTELEALGGAQSGVMVGEVTSVALAGEVESVALAGEVKGVALGEARSFALEEVLSPENVTLGEAKSGALGKVESEGGCNTQ